MRIRSRPKYGNQKKNGSASKREAKRLAELRLMEKAGEIADLRTQIKFELIPAQYVDGKCVERSISYVADFVFNDKTGAMRVQDAKGFVTPVWIIKRKLMRFFLGIAVEEV